MPELPEVETTRRGIEPFLLHQTIQCIQVRESRLRWPIPKDINNKVKNTQVTAVTRRGKYLLLGTTKGHLIAHLGMSGSYRVLEKAIPPEKHDHFDLILSNGTVLRYRDPRKFGALLWTEEQPESHKLLNHLGPEPLSDDFDTNYLYQALQKRKAPIKVSIMDSKVVVGVGNIYANEALFSAGIHPKRAANRISKPRIEALVAAIRAILASAIAQGGTTLRDFSGSDGNPGYFKQTLHVYGRADLPCTQCSSPLKEIRMGNRSTVYCSECQR